MNTIDAWEIPGWAGERPRIGRALKDFASRGWMAVKCAAVGRGETMTNAQQFELFMRQYQNMVFSTAMRLLGKQADAEDIAQEVFLRAYERFDELRDNPRAPGWLKTVAVNLSLNHLSRYRRRWTFFSEFLRPGEDEVEVEFPAPDNVSEEAACRDRRAVIEQALQTLSPAQRVPLALFHLEGLRYEEIAVKLGVSLGKVKTDIFRGRKALRRKLGPWLAREPGGNL